MIRVITKADAPKASAADKEWTTPADASEQLSLDRRSRKDRRVAEHGLPSGIFKERRLRPDQRKPVVNEIQFSEWAGEWTQFLAQAAGKSSTTDSRRERIGFEWRDSMDIGVPEIDYQHRQLAISLNALYDVMQPPFVRETFNKSLNAFSVAMQQHMTDEERFMDRVGLDQSVLHKEIHRHMSDRFDAYNRSFEKDEITAEVLFSTLSKWLAYHIEGDDHMIGNFFATATATAKQAD